MADELSLSFEILADEDADPVVQRERALRLREQALRLRAELLDGPVLTVENGQADLAPELSKGLGGLTPELVVSMAVTALPAVILLVQNWMLRQKDHSLRVKIKEVEIEIPRGTSPQEIERLVKIVEKTARRMK